MESQPRSMKEHSEFQGPLLTNNARRRSLESCVSPFDPKATGRKSKISRVGHERQRRLGDPFGGTFAGPYAFLLWQTEEWKNASETSCIYNKADGHPV